MKRILTILLAAMLILSMGIQTAFAEATLRIVAEPYDTSPYRILHFDEQGRVEMYNTADGGVYRGNIENGKFPVNPEKIKDSYEPDPIATEDRKYATFFDAYNKLGFRDAQGNVMIEPGTYDDIRYWFRINWVEVVKGGKHGLFNFDSGVEIPVIYDEITTSQSGALFIVVKDGKSAVLDASGREVFPMIDGAYHFIVSKEKNVAFIKVTNADGKEGLMLPNGQYVFKPEYDSCSANVGIYFPKNYFIVRTKVDGERQKAGLIDINGNALIAMSPGSLSFYDRFIAVRPYGGRSYVLDEDLNEVFSGFDSVDTIGTADMTVFEVWNDEDCTVVDERGNEMFTSNSGELMSYSLSYIGDGYFFGINDKGSIFTDSTGEIISRDNFDGYWDKVNCGRFFIVSINDKYGVYDLKSTRLLTSCEYDGLSIYSVATEDNYDEKTYGTVFAASKGGLIGVIDPNGKEIVPCSFKKVELTDFGCYRVLDKNNKYGLYSASGKQIYACEYQEIEGICNAETQFYYVKKDGKYGFADASFNIVIFPEYDNLNLRGSGCYLLIKHADGKDLFGILMLSDSPFNDVIPGSYYEDAVKWAKDNGVTSGTSAGTFSPEKKCNRAQVVTFLWNAAGQPEPETADNPFTDVKTTDWYYKSVLWAVEQGITSGTSATTFSPLKDCTNAHVLTFLWNFMGQPETEGDGNWYSYAMNWAEANGLNAGIDGADVALGVCPRKDIVTFMYRYFTRE